jgi:hypothetical protein
MPNPRPRSLGNKPTLGQRLALVQRAIANNLDQGPPQIIPYRGWKPDRPALGNPGEIEATNVLPDMDGYTPWQGLSVQGTEALDARCQGAFPAEDAAGNVFIYAGDATKLYQINADDSLHNVSRADGYQTPADQPWEFVQFGDQVIATNYADPVQKATIGSGTFADALTSDLRPKARHVAVIRDFVVTGFTNDGTDGEQPRRVWWWAINSTTDAQPAAATQSDYQDVPDVSLVQRITGGSEYGLVFTDKTIERFTYIGSPLIFQRDTIDEHRGTPIPGSVIRWGKRVFFIAEEGFMVNMGRGESIPIGDGQVDKKFWNDFNSTYISRVWSAIDPLNKVVIWGFPGESQSTPGEPNRIWACYYPELRWSEAEIDFQIVFGAREQGLTLEGLDTISSSIDTLPFSLDSRAYTGGRLISGAFNSSNRLCFFTGSNLAATIVTGEHQPVRNQRSQITAGRPLVDGGSPTLAVGSRVTPQATPGFTSAAAINNEGLAPLNQESRYHRFRTIVPAESTWDHAQGVEFFATGTGSQ